MRRVVVSELVSSDGVAEDPSRPLQFGGEEQQEYEYDELADALLLGRKTNEGFAAAWPGMAERTGEYGAGMNGYPKHVASRTLQEPPEWNAGLLGQDGALKLLGAQTFGSDVAVLAYHPGDPR